MAFFDSSSITAFFDGLGSYHKVILLLAIVMLLWDTIEVGRNDAANLVNAVFGSRVLSRRTCIYIAGVAVIFGAALSSDVIDTARKGIFDPTALGSLDKALAVYASVYIVDTVLLYGYSAFGMPVSTTACLVFELLGAAMAANIASVHWNKAGIVILGIFCSIALSGMAAFVIQRAARGALRDKATSLPALLLHGGWIGGGMMAGLGYFLLLKGMKNVAIIKSFNAWLASVDQQLDAHVTGFGLLLVMWAGCAIFIHLSLVVFRKRAARVLFPALAVLGMIAMAFAFGQNDLANCASPGLSAIKLLEVQNLEIATKVGIEQWQLIACGMLLFVGMTTKNAERVTKAAVATGSMGNHVALWAPNWCVSLAERLLRNRSHAAALAPRGGITAEGKTVHYDSLRASVIVSVSASVIATASSLKLPVSTTYVAFAAIVATGLADRILQRGDAELKLGRSIWIVTSWVLSAFIATATTFLVVLVVIEFQTSGIVLCVGANLLIRRFLKKRADLQARRVEDEAYEREHPEEFALEAEDE